MPINNYKGPKLYNMPIKPAISGGTIVPSFADDKTRAQKKKQLDEYVKIQRAIAEGAEYRRKQQRRYEDSLRAQKEDARRAYELRKKRQQEEDEEIKKRRAEDEAKLEADKEANDELENKQYAEWLKKHGYDSSIEFPLKTGLVGGALTSGALNAGFKTMFNIQNMIGSLAKGSTSAHLTELGGKSSTVDIKKKEAEAHLKTIDIQNSIDQAKQQAEIYKEIYAPKPGETDEQRAQAYNELQNKLSEIYNGIDQLKAQLESPELKQLDEGYKIDQYIDNGGLFDAAWDVFKDSVKGLTILDSKKEKLRSDLAAARRAELASKYDTEEMAKAIANSPENIQKMNDISHGIAPDEQKLAKNLNQALAIQKAYTPSELTTAEKNNIYNLDKQKTEQYIKDQDIKKAQYQQDYFDTIAFQDKMDKMFPVASSYSKGEELNQNSSMFDWNYWKYVMPGMIGSSNSSMDQIKANAIQTVGTIAGLALAKPTGGASLGLINAATVVSAPWQVKGALAENFGQIGDRRTNTLAEALSQYTDDKGNNDLVNNLKKQAIAYWKSAGKSDEWINKRYNSNTDADLTNIIQDVMMGNVVNHDPRLALALHSSLKGLSAEFWADNLRTAGELPVQLVSQLIPTGPIRKVGSIAMDKAMYSNIGKLSKKVAAGKMTETAAEKVAERYVRRYGNRLAAGSKFVNGFNATKKFVSYLGGGFEKGAEVADALGFGYGGHIIGGTIGAITKPVFRLGGSLMTPEMRASMADMGQAFMRKYRLVYDKLLPTDWARLAARYGFNAAGRGVTKAMSEGSEEAAQELNAREDFASKYGFSVPNVSELLANDIAQGSRIAQAYLSLLGLSKSELYDDEQYWQNVKGGLALGFCQPAIMNIAGTVPNAIRQYKSDQVITESLIMNREADKFNRNSNVRFAEEAMKGHGDDLLASATDLYEQDKLRDGDNRKYTDDDYNDKLNAIRGINGLVRNQRVRNMLEAKGFVFGTKEYAHAVADIYNNQESLLENQKQSQQHNSKLQELYNSKEFQDEVDNVLKRASTDDASFQNSLQRAQDEAAAKVEAEMLDNAKRKHGKAVIRNKKELFKAKQEARDQAKADWLHNVRDNVIYQTRLANRLRALLKIKQQQKTLKDIYDTMSKFNVRTKKPDAGIISKNIDQQIKEVQEAIKEFDKDVDFGSTIDSALNAVNNLSYLVESRSDEIQQSDLAMAMLQADRQVTQNTLDLFQYGIVKTKDGKYQYNEKQYIKEKDRDRRLQQARRAGDEELVKQIESEDTDVQYLSGMEKFDGYRKRIEKIMNSTKVNEALDWMISDMYYGDGVSAYMEGVEKEHEAAAKRVTSEQVKYKPEEVKGDPLATEEVKPTETKPIESKPQPEVVTTPEETTTKFEQTADKRKQAFNESNLKYQKNKQKAQEAYERRKKRYKNWKKGNLNAALIPFQDAIVSIANRLMKNAEIGTYKIQEFIEDVKEIAGDIDIKDYIPQLKQLYIKNATKIAFQYSDHPEYIDNMSSDDEVIAYGVQLDPLPVQPEPKAKNPVQDILNKDAEKIDKKVSSYYDVIVQTENGPVLCSNNEAIQKIKDGHKSTIEDIKNKLESVKDNDELLLQSLQSIFKGTPVHYQAYLKYKNVDGIFEAIARNYVSNKPTQSLIDGIKVRNAVIATLLDNESSLNSADYGSTFDQFIEQCRQLRDSLKGAGWDIVSVNQNVYDLQSKTCEQADIILTNDKGEIRIIDVLSSYADIRARWDYKPGMKAYYTISQRENDILHSLQDILTVKLGKPINYLGVLPVTIDSRNDQLFIQTDENGQIKFIEVTPKNDLSLSEYDKLSDEEYNQQLDEKTRILHQIIQECNDNIEQYTELCKKVDKLGGNSLKSSKYTLLQFTNPITLQDCDDQIRRVLNIIEDVNEANNQLSQIYNSLKSVQKDSEDREAMTAYFEDYFKTAENVSMQAVDKLGLLEDSCMELDQLADRFIGGSIVDDNDKTLVKKLYKAIFDAQSALDDVLSDPETNTVDVTQEEELIASVMEKIVTNRKDLGAMSMFVQKWWITNLASINNENYGTYMTKINSWTTTLRNHVLRDLDNHPGLQRWYNSLLNNYFTILLNNASEFSDKLPQGVEKTLLDNAIKTAHDLIQDFNLGWGDKEDVEFPAPPKDEVERINRMPHAYRDKYNISFQHPLSWDAMSINNNYWWMSKQPDFAEKATFSLLIADKDKTYTNPRTAASYTIRKGDVVMYVTYVDKDGKKHFADIPLFINKAYFPNASQEDLDRIDRINRAQVKFANRLKKQLDYIKKHPEYKLDLKVSTNKGSIDYDKNGNYHSVTEFLFKGEGNNVDLYTVKTSRESRLGISVFVKNKDKFTYDVFGGDGLQQRIGGFDDEFDKNNLRTNSGLLIYFYYAGNNKFIGAPISGNRIGEETAKKLVDILTKYAEGETTYNGYDSYQLLRQFLYITDPKNPRKITEYNNINKLVSVVNGNVVIGNQAISIGDRQAIISKIASMSCVINHEDLNINFNDQKANSVLKQVYSQFQMDGSLQQVTLPNGLIINRSDFTHVNSDNSMGTTWLGYMFRNNMLVTKAVGQSYTQANIQSCDIVPKNQPDLTDNTKSIQQQIKQQQQQQQANRRSLFNWLTYKQENKSNEKWSKQTEDDVIQFFDEVLGDLASQGKTLNLVDDTCLSQLGNEYIMGVCHALSIELSKCAPKSAAYHEAFHKIFELLIPEKTRDILYSKYRDRHKGVSDRQIAEAFADMFMEYMDNRRDSDKSKWYKRIYSWFKKIGITLGIFRKIGLSGTRQLYSVFDDVTAGKYRNAKISDKQKERFERLFGTGLNYTITDPKTKAKTEFKNLNNSSDVSDMVSTLGFYAAKIFKLDDFNATGSKLKDGEQLVKALPAGFIDGLTGKGIDENQLTDSQKAFKEIFEQKYEYIYAEGADAYSRPIGKKATYPKLDALVPKVNDYLKEIITSYAGKINDQDETDDDVKVMRNNTDKFDRPSYEFSKLDSIPESAKFFFATVPYLTWGEDGGNRVMQFDLSKNRFSSPMFMPIEEVYNVVVNEFGKLSTPAQLDSALAERANKKPMYKYLYDKFHALYQGVYTYNEDGSITVDYDKEAYMIQIVNAIHSLKHTYIFGQSKTQSDGSKHIYIKESSLDRDSRQFSSQWTTFLLSGQVSVFNRNRDKNGNLTFCDGMGGKNGTDIFNRTADFLQNIRNWITSTSDDLVIDGVVYNKNVHSDIEALKLQIIDKLNRIGIIFTKDAFDYMLSDSYGDISYDGLASMFTNRGVSQITTFIDLIRSFVSKEGVINQRNVNEGYVKNGFVKELGNKQGAYNRITINNMAQGLGGKRYFSISQNNSISTIVDAINTNDINNPTLHTLTKFGYNVTENNGFPMGSIILSQLLNNQKNALRVYTYLGLKTDNKGDNGTEYKAESEIDDYVTKMAMLQQGILIFPTLADKGTWMCIDGVKMPGMKFTEQVDEYGNKRCAAINVPKVQWIGNNAYIRPSDDVLNQMIQYAECERLAICQCMEDLGYDNIPGYQKQNRKPIPKEAYIKNYHTPNKVKVGKETIKIEPNGTRFLSLTEIKVLKTDQNGEQYLATINFNDPRKSSTDLLKLAYDEFFSKSLAEKQQIMAYTLGTQYELEVEKAIELGIIERQEITEPDEKGVSKTLPNCKKEDKSLLNLKNIHLDNNQIQAVMTEILNQLTTWRDRPIGPAKNARIECCKSLAIAMILSDATTKSIISSQEVFRCFSGHPALFKVKYDYKNGCIKDSTFDIQKRIGGMVSTGEDNMTDIPLLSKTYRCAECEDYVVSSTSDIAKDLDLKFKASSMKESFAIAAEKIIDEQNAELEFNLKASIKKYDDDFSKRNLKETLEWKEKRKADVWKAIYEIKDEDIDSISDVDFIKSLFYTVGLEEPTDHQIKQIRKSLDKAKSLAHSFSDAYKGDINVADGASYITADMCEDLLRMRGQLTGKVKAAFDLLKGDQKYSWTSLADAYDTVYNAVNIVTTKYTAYGVRDHTLYNDKYNGEVSDVAVTYYNKYALFPLFPCIATGRMGAIYQKMLDEKVDTLFMTSAVKVGSQGAVEFNGETIDKPFNVYTQQYSFLRRQLNTDPEEGEAANLGTQMVKIVLQNLRLLRDNYISAKDGSKNTGKQLLSDFMQAINKLEEIGKQELYDKFFTNGKLDNQKLCDYLQSQLSSRNANKGLLEALQLNKDKELNCPIAATSDSSWIESIFKSTIDKAIIKIPTPGNSFVQRSVFAVENSQTKGGKIEGRSVYNGHKLQMINKDGSMDAVISIDYFDYILPKRKMSFEEKRQWLIDHKIIGEDAEANTIGYRIPTQAQSSIHALRFVDVIPAVKSTIILPEEFTKITGSDFDIDHLYLASLNYKVEDNGNVSIIKDGESKERYQNDLLYYMLTLLKDTDNSINSLYKSIDNDTELPKSIADQIPETSSNKAKAYNFGTLHEQAERRLDYVTGKNGIGPFALNVTNHVLTCLFGVKFRETKFTEQTGIFNFDKLVDDDGNMISSWLSAFINAHVDIVKDPWISKMGVDPFTYNMVNLLIRSGFGEAGMWFIAQPIIKDMANASSTASSQFTRDTFKHKSVYAAQKDAVANAVMAYLDEDDVKESKLETYIGSNPSSEQVGARIDVVNYIKTHQKLLKEIAINPGKKTVIVDGKEYNVKEVQKTIFYAWKTLEKYSIALSTLVQYTKIDTCKQGKTFIEMYRYLDMYDRLLNNDKSLWDRKSIENLVMHTWIESKTRDACTFPLKVLSTQLFNANENFIQRLVLPICNALKNADDPLNVDMMNEVSQSLQTSIKSKYIVDYAHHQLGMTDQDISNLFVGPRSMNHRFNMLWNAIRTNPKYSYLANNQLLTHLYSVNEESEVWVNGRQYERPSFLSISDSIEDSRLNSDLMIDGWEDLLRDSDVNVKNFAKDLIIYAFLTSGEYKGWNRLFKFVPPAWVRGEIGSFEKVGSFSDYIRKILSGDTLSSVQYQSYLDEIIANHFSDNRFSTRMSLKDKDGNNNFITCGDIIAIGAGKEHEIFPQYITIKKSGRSGKNTSDYTTYRFSYSFSTKENPKIFYPVYARAKRKGYQSMDGKFNIYEYGWHFNYVENESDAFSTFDYDEALMKVAVYLSQHPVTQNQINNATNISILSDRISKVYLGYVIDQVEDNNNQTESVSQELQTVTNVYAGTNENANLSNFALRPFETTIGKFDTVEGAFQAAKIYYTNGTKYLIRDDKGIPTGLTEEGKSVIRRLMTVSGSEARSIGRNISDLNEEAWKERSTKFLEDFMRRSFEQNPQARKELTNTGNSTITHKNKQGVEQDEGRFSSILTKIRDEFKSLLPNPNSNKIEQHIGDWSRTEVEQHPNYLYIFTDNTDRDSGSQLIDPNSKYARKYGQNKHYPKVTQAVIRGLDNAMPLSTQHWYHGDKKGKTGVWTDADIEDFKKTIDSEIDDIIKEWDTGKYEKLIIGDGDAFFNSNISNISITRTPKLYQYLKQKVQELYKYIDENDTNQGSLNQNDTDQFGTPSEQASTLNSDKTILTNAEILALHPFTGNDTKPRIAVASEHTDPAFFSKMIQDWAKGNHTFIDYKNNPIEYKDIDALYLITKHDGLPMRELLQLDKPKIIHFSVTTLGATKWEPGVMKWQDMIERIGDFIKQGLDPEYVTLRIDPIVPGVTNMTEVDSLMKRASELGLKHVRFSVLDYYKTTATFMEQLGYDYSKYFDKNNSGFYFTHARKEVIEGIAKQVLSIAKKYNLDLSSCAEPCRMDGISIEGCLSVNAINKMLGTHIPNKFTENNKFRPECTCYGGKTDLLRYNSNCASSCVYCYAHHNSDRMLNYYNEDGTLKQNRFTDSGLNKPVTKKIDALSISDKTETFGVHIDPNIVRNYKTWLNNNKDGIVAYRMHKDRFNTKQNVEEGIIGNPFDWRKYGTDKCLQMFADWLITGNNFGESLANDEYRSAIINKLLSIDKPNILYYKELNKPSHATILGYLIEHKELLQSTTQFTKTKKTPKNYQEYIDVIQKYFDIGYTTGRIGKNAANQVIQKLHIHIDEDSDLFDAMKKNNLSERDLLNALYVLASYLNKPEMKGRTTLSSQQINEIQSKLNTEMISSDILGMTGGYYRIKESTNDSLIVDTQLMSDIDFLLQNKKYEPIYQQLLDYAMNDKYINEYYEDIVDIFNMDHIDFSDLIHVYSTFDNVNQLELFSEEDMKKAKEIKNHCKGGN